MPKPQNLKWWLVDWCGAGGKGMSREPHQANLVSRYPVEEEEDEFNTVSPLRLDVCEFQPVVLGLALHGLILSQSRLFEVITILGTGSR